MSKYFYKLSLKRNREKYIDDDNLRDYMMPNYGLGCRRVIPSNAYLSALPRDNVEVDTSGIESITPAGVRTKDGKDIPLDILVYATGYFAYTNVKKMLSFQVYGKEGRNLNSEWETEAVSYLGITVSGYPNYFKINGPNAGTGHSSQISYMEVMVNYAVDAICAVKRDKSIKAIDARSDPQREYVKKMRSTMKSTVWQNGSCKSFYRKGKTGEVTSLSPESVIKFIVTRKWFHLGDYQLLK
ncbi:MAG: cation diffusion facilitator CzcD-associated flavoprotein CzcO [Glaciecola sp.]|uniref:hypothetical protein n=1 Tax=Congregibacter sp. TaxID=2744308 RepID=UPI0039E2687C